MNTHVMRCGQNGMNARNGFAIARPNEIGARLLHIAEGKVRASGDHEIETGCVGPEPCCGAYEGQGDRRAPCSTFGAALCGDCRVGGPLQILV
jgi:hypothetical protein